MADMRKHSSTSNLIRFVLKHATTGVGLTGLSSASSGLIISTIADNEATATTYTVAGSTIESITTLGTFAAPTATKCRFKEVDATNHKGLYEFQFADARFSVASAKRLIISVTGATNLLDADYEIQLVQFDPYDSVRMGMTALPNAAAEAAGGLYTRGTGAGQIAQDANGNIRANVDTIKTQAITCAAGVTIYAHVGTAAADTAQTGDGYAILNNGTYGNSALNATLAVIAAYIDTEVAAILAAVDTEVAAIKAKTDNLPASPAAVGSAMVLSATGLDAVPYTATGAVALGRAFWSDTLTIYTDGMAGKRVRGITAVPVEEGTIVDAAPTSTSFTTSLTGYGDDHFNDQLLLVEMSANKWQARTITDYVSATGQVIVEEAFTSAPANGSAIAVRAEHIHPASVIAAAALTLQMTESYRATNAAPTLTQAICEILAHLGEMGIVGTTKTLKKFDGVTSSGKTFTLNDATNPTSITETT